MPQGGALTTASTAEIVAAYYTPPTVIPSYGDTDSWTLLGEFYLPRSCDARTEAMVLVTDADLQLTVRLYDTVDGAVSGSEATSSALSLALTHSGTVTLTGGRRYQFHGRITLLSGGATEDRFGFVSSATISD